MELARWDGDLLTLDTRALLRPFTGPIELVIHLGNGTPLTWEPMVIQVMARIPTPAELFDLVRTAEAGWTRTERRMLIVRARALDELEARAAWGDR